jgi:hypothetical protein
MLFLPKSSLTDRRAFLQLSRTQSNFGFAVDAAVAFQSYRANFAARMVLNVVERFG